MLAELGAIAIIAFVLLWLIQMWPLAPKPKLLVAAITVLIVIFIVVGLVWGYGGIGADHPHWHWRRD